MSTPDCTTPTKTCTTCGIEYPVTPEFWHRNKRSEDGFVCQCKPCISKRTTKWYIENKEHAKKKAHEWRLKNIERAKANDHEKYLRNPQRMKERVRIWKQQNRESVRASSRKTARKYYKEHTEEMREKSRNWNRTHREYVHEKNRQWFKNNRDAARARSHRRRARKLSLPDTITKQDIQFSLEYFHYCCAVCGRPLNGLWHTGALDHWIPLNSPDCPGSIPTNEVPLCHGLDGCNNIKGDKDPVQWLIEKYGKRKANIILKRIAAYFATLSK